MSALGTSVDNISWYDVGVLISVLQSHVDSQSSTMHIRCKNPWLELCALGNILRTMPQGGPFTREFAANRLGRKKSTHIEIEMDTTLVAVANKLIEFLQESVAGEFSSGENRFTTTRTIQYLERQLNGKGYQDSWKSQFRKLIDDNLESGVAVE